MEESLQKSWMNNLRKLKESKGWSQRDLEREAAKYGNLNQKTISSYLKEGGDLPNPTLSKMELLAKCFGVDAHIMLKPDLNMNDFEELNDESIYEAMKKAITLLSESRVLSIEEADIFYKNIDNLMDTMVIILQSKDEYSLVLGFLKFLNSKNDT